MAFFQSTGSIEAMPADLFRAVVDDAPVALMTCDPKTMLIDYANRASVGLLQKLRHILDIDPNQIVGTSVDRFHRKPAHQQSILRDPTRLPHSARITLADEVLDLHISAIHDAKGRYVRAALMWNIVTEKVKADADTARLLQMLDKMPINVMTCDPVTFDINYCNQTSIDTLTKLEQHLPIKASALRGASVDVFHKNPAHQRRMLGDPKNLPHSALIRVGPETLRLDISAIIDDKGAYLGPMLTWTVDTYRVKLAEEVNNVVTSMDEVANGLDRASTELGHAARAAQEKASSVSAASQEMSASIKEITQRMTENAALVDKATAEAEVASGRMANLAEKSGKIGEITSMIEAIASQTKLLALNATIEAARAGEAGRGFAVVASEVKALSEQTGRATNEIRAQIGGMQQDTASAVQSTQDISKVIAEVQKFSTALAGAMEEQQAVTDEVAGLISGVSAAADASLDAAGNVTGLVGRVREASALNSNVRAYLTKR